MKGVELPISTIVVIVLILIVMLAVIGLFYGIWPIGAQTATLESVKTNACNMLMSTGGCSSTDSEVTKYTYISNFDANKDGKTNDGASGIEDPADPNSCKPLSNSNDNLFMLCKCWYGIGSDIDKTCRTQICHCPTP